MNKIKNRLVNFLFLGLSCVPISAFALPQYQLCSKQQKVQLIKQFSLKQIQSSEEYPSYSSCVVLNAQQKLIAISNPIHTESDYADYDLNLYLIDTQKQQILKKYKESQSTASDAAHFENMQFDTNPFSTSNAKQLIGLRFQHGHLGSDSFTIKELKLFELDTQNNMRLVLDSFRTDFEGETRPHFKCQDGLYTNSKVLLIPQQSTTNGLNDFKIKETVFRQEPNENSCKVKKINKSKTHYMRFDGKKYDFKHLNFLDYGI